LTVCLLCLSVYCLQRYLGPPYHDVGEANIDFMAV
jgi:hypothetical protein